MEMDGSATTVGEGVLLLADEFRWGDSLFILDHWLINNGRKARLGSYWKKLAMRDSREFMGALFPSLQIS